MKKNEFLKKLEDKLLVLSESERHDIINEYKDIIDEKVKNGEKESDAIKDFGDIDTLSKEILGAYKINVDYLSDKSKKNKEIDKTAASSFEDFIKSIATTISEFTKTVVKELNFNSKDLTLEYIFEIILKVIILLIICSILRFPFYLINELGRGILSIVIHPIDKILYFIFKFITGIIYLVSCVFVGLAIFKSKKQNKKDKQTSTQDNIELNKEETTKKKASKKTSDSGLINVFLICLKIFVIFMTLPLIMTSIGIGLSLFGYIYLIICGLKIFSFLVLLLGIFIIITSILRIIYNALFSHKPLPWLSFIFGFVVAIVGGMWVLHDVLSFGMIQYVPSNIIETNTYEEEITTTDFTKNKYSYNITLDDTLEDDKIIVKVKYYNDYLKIDGLDINDNRIRVNSRSMIDNHKIQDIIDIVIEGLNNRTIYLVDLTDYDIEICANKNTIDKLNENIEE